MGEVKDQRREETTAIVCRIDDQWARCLATIAEELAALSVRGIVAPGVPHISLKVIEGELSPEAIRSVREELSNLQPLEVTFRGVGRFVFPRPVIYVTVVRNRALERLHRRVRRALRSFSVHADRLYSPRQWVPHVSLLMDDSGEDITPRLRDFEAKGAFRGTALVEVVEILGPIGEGEVVWRAGTEEGEEQA